MQVASPSRRRYRAGRTGVDITAVIPAKNEAGNIAWVLERLPRSVDEVVLVDGTSTDGTVEVARGIRPDVVIVSETRRGKGAALRAGVEAATGAIVVMLDADGSMDPGEIERFIEGVRRGHDLVKGSRFLPGAGTGDMTALRSVGNRGLLTVANLLFRSSHTDLCYGYAAFRRDAFLGLGLTADGFEIEAQLFLRARRHGLRVTEIPSYEAPRRMGNSNLNTFRDGWRVLRTILGERVRRVPARVAVEVGPAEGARAGVLAEGGASAGVVPAATTLWGPAFTEAVPAARRSFRRRLRPSMPVSASLSRATADLVEAARDAAGLHAEPSQAVEIAVLPRQGGSLTPTAIAAGRVSSRRVRAVDVAGGGLAGLEPGLTEPTLADANLEVADAPEASRAGRRRGAGMVAGASRAVPE